MVGGRKQVYVVEGIILSKWIRTRLIWFHTYLPFQSTRFSKRGLRLMFGLAGKKFTENVEVWQLWLGRFQNCLILTLISYTPGLSKHTLLWDRSSFFVRPSWEIRSLTTLIMQISKLSYIIQGFKHTLYHFLSWFHTFLAFHITITGSSFKFCFFCENVII